MEISAAIKNAVTLFREHADLDDSELVEALSRNGIECQLAERLVEFVPLAFFRATMPTRRGQFADHYVRMAPDGSVSPNRSLAGEPVYVAALKEARAEIAAGVPRDAYFLVASRSSELAAAKNLAESGGNPSTAIFSPPVFLRWVDENDEPAGQATARKWWQFWK